MDSLSKVIAFDGDRWLEVEVEGKEGDCKQQDSDQVEHTMCGKASSLCQR